MFPQHVITAVLNFIIIAPINVLSECEEIPTF
jgi:hypothetical protein